MVLETILAETRADLARRKGQRPLARLLADLTPSDRPFGAALAGRRPAYIMECKRASPTEGVLRPDYDPAALAAAYTPHASAISVLTDGPFFGGSLDHLDAARAATGLPILRKDFVVDPYQVIEARVHGADAVLLMLSVLDDAGWRECAAAARQAGLDTLTEVHTPAELDRALALDAPVIGINNRDLATLRVDLATTRRLAPRVPPDRIVIAESGLARHGDALALAPLVDGFLVGTAFMREPDLNRAVRRLVYGVVKICGLTREEDARTAFRLGATFGGLIFAPESPRRVDEPQAAALVRAAPLRWAGVFVNERPERVGSLASALGLAAVQLHGDEDRMAVEAVRRAVPAGCEVWKAVRVRDHIPRVDETGADRVVLDTWVADRRGGTGARFDWALVAGYPDRDRVLLGGGIAPEQIAAAQALETWGLDVNSGVEEAPGVKSAERLDTLFAACRGRRRATEAA